MNNKMVKKLEETMNQSKDNDKKKTNNPSRLKTAKDAGIYVKLTKVRRSLNEEGINKIYIDAINEIKRSDPELTEGAELVPINKMSTSTQKIIELAKEHDALLRSKEKNVKSTTKKIKRKNDKKRTKYSDLIQQVSKLKYKFQNKCTRELSAYLCAAFHELLSHSMNNVICNKSKIIYIRHLLSPGYENLIYNSFYTKTSLWKNALKENKKRLELEEQKRLDKKKNKNNPNAGGAFTGLSKKSKNKTKKANISHETKVSKESSSEETGKFEHYIKQICHNIMNIMIQQDNHLYSSIRLSREVKEFCSDLIISFIERLCPLIKEQLNLMKIKTVKEYIIKTLIKQMLLIEGDVDIAACEVSIKDKIDAYEKYTKLRREEKKKNKKDKKNSEKNSSKEEDSEDENSDDGSDSE